MSSASPFRRSLLNAPHRGVRRFESLLTGSVRFAGFWSAVTLPFVLLGLMTAGLADQHTGLFAGLVVANILALRVGHAHNRG